MSTKIPHETIDGVEITLNRYDGWAPTAHDTKGLCSTNDPEDGPCGSWYVAPCGHNRDSGYGTEANWEAVGEILAKVDPEGSDVQEHRFEHWGPGWFEIRLVRPGTQAAKAAQETYDALQDYPIVCESKWSEKEWEAAHYDWQHMGLKDRVELCSRCGVNIMAARHEDIIPEQCWEEIQEHLICE